MDTILSVKLLAIWMLFFSATPVTSLRCYWCSGVNEDRACEMAPHNVTTGPGSLECDAPYCTSTKVIHTVSGTTKSMARNCDSFWRGNFCYKGSGQTTCYETCDTDLCNYGNWGDDLRYSKKVKVTVHSLGLRRRTNGVGYRMTTKNGRRLRFKPSGGLVGFFRDKLKVRRGGGGRVGKGYNLMDGKSLKFVGKRYRFGNDDGGGDGGGGYGRGWFHDNNDESDDNWSDNGDHEGNNDGDDYNNDDDGIDNDEIPTRYRLKVEGSYGHGKNVRDDNDDVIDANYNNGEKHRRYYKIEKKKNGNENSDARYDDLKVQSRVKVNHQNYIFTTSDHRDAEGGRGKDFNANVPERSRTDSGDVGSRSDDLGDGRVEVEDDYTMKLFPGSFDDEDDDNYDNDVDFDYDEYVDFLDDGDYGDDVNNIEVVDDYDESTDIASNNDSDDDEHDVYDYYDNGDGIASKTIPGDTSDNNIDKMLMMLLKTLDRERGNDGRVKLDKPNGIEVTPGSKVGEGKVGRFVYDDDGDNDIDDNKDEEDKITENGIDNNADENIYDDVTDNTPKPILLKTFRYTENSKHPSGMVEPEDNRNTNIHFLTSDGLKERQPSKKFQNLLVSLITSLDDSKLMSTTSPDPIQLSFGSSESEEMTPEPVQDVHNGITGTSPTPECFCKSSDKEDEILSPILKLKDEIDDLRKNPDDLSSEYNHGPNDSGGIKNELSKLFLPLLNSGNHEGFEPRDESARKRNGLSYLEFSGVVRFDDGGFGKSRKGDLGVGVEMRVRGLSKDDAVDRLDEGKGWNERRGRRRRKRGGDVESGRVGSGGDGGEQRGERGNVINGRGMERIRERGEQTQNKQKKKQIAMATGNLYPNVGSTTSTRIVLHEDDWRRLNVNIPPFQVRDQDLEPSNMRMNLNSVVKENIPEKETMNYKIARSLNPDVKHERGNILRRLPSSNLNDNEELFSDGNESLANEVRLHFSDGVVSATGNYVDSGKSKGLFLHEPGSLVLSSELHINEDVEKHRIGNSDDDDNDQAVLYTNEERPNTKIQSDNSNSTLNYSKSISQTINHSNNEANSEKYAMRSYGQTIDAEKHATNSSQNRINQSQNYGTRSQNKEKHSHNNVAHYNDDETISHNNRTNSKNTGTPKNNGTSPRNIKNSSENNATPSKNNETHSHENGTRFINNITQYNYDFAPIMNNETPSEHNGTPKNNGNASEYNGVLSQNNEFDSKNNGTKNDEKLNNNGTSTNNGKFSKNHLTIASKFRMTATKRDSVNIQTNSSTNNLIKVKKFGFESKIQDLDENYPIQNSHRNEDQMKDKDPIDGKVVPSKDTNVTFAAFESTSVKVVPLRSTKVNHTSLENTNVKAVQLKNTYNIKAVQLKKTHVKAVQLKNTKVKALPFLGRIKKPKWQDVVLSNKNGHKIHSYRSINDNDNTNNGSMICLLSNLVLMLVTALGLFGLNVFLFQ